MDLISLQVAQLVLTVTEFANSYFPAAMSFPTSTLAFLVLPVYSQHQDRGYLFQATFKVDTCRHTKKGDLKNDPRDFPGGAVVKNPPAAVVKNPPANAGDTGSSPGPGRSHMPWSN